jgi:hypothetical protein
MKQGMDTHGTPGAWPALSGSFKSGGRHGGSRIRGVRALTAAAVVATLACGCASKDVRPLDEAVAYQAVATDLAAAAAGHAAAAREPGEPMVLAMPLTEADRAIRPRVVAGAQPSAPASPATEAVRPTIASKPALEGLFDDEEFTLPLAKVRQRPNDLSAINRHIPQVP